MSAWKTATLCAACQARRGSADGHTREYAARTTPEAPDVLATREHRIRIATWAACTSCTGGSR